MTWFLHDSSLSGQYATPQVFANDLQSLLQLRNELIQLRENLRCSRTIGNRAVTKTSNFRDVVLGFQNQALKRLVLDWINTRGPFIEDDVRQVDENYFECQGEDVTDGGAGEAARRSIHGDLSRLHSFPNGGFDFSPVRIEQGLEEERVGVTYLENSWTINALRESVLMEAANYANWTQVLDYAKIRFNNLIFASNLNDYLNREPFSLHVAENIFSKLEVLQKFIDSRNPDGTNSIESDRIIADHFSGAKAWFTDESEGNKKSFKSEMTFCDPSNKDVKIFCPFHGKIKTPQYRIHFPWPLRKDEKKVKIVYIGAKITKT